MIAVLKNEDVWEEGLHLLSGVGATRKTIPARIPLTCDQLHHQP